MDTVSALLQFGTLFIALTGVIIALVQLRSANRDAKASRLAEMSWQVYQSYTDPRIRDARGAAELIAHTEPVIGSGIDYGERYADKEHVVPEPQTVTLDTHMRRLLRFYNQVAVLLEKNLVDDDLVIAFVGPGLKTSWPAIAAAVEWYQYYYGGQSGFELADRRPIYTSIPGLYQRYLVWESRE